MEISKLVKELEEKTKKSPISLDSGMIDLDLDESKKEFCNKAFQKICHLWNNTDGSRKFVKHLIKDFAFCSDPKIVVKFKEDIEKEDRNRCAILGIKLAELEAITRMDLLYKTKEGIIRNTMESEGRSDYTEKEKKELREFLRREFPIEVRTLSFAVFSTNSEKFLSMEALYALKAFVLLAEKEPEINKLINFKTNKKKKTNYSKKKKGAIEKPSQGTFNMSNIMDDDSIEALKNIK